MRHYLNKYLKFDVVCKHFLFEVLVTLVVLLNISKRPFFPSTIIVILIIYNVTDDEPTRKTIDDINRILTWIYLGEVIIKILGLGIIPYFSDRWNV